MEQQTYRILAEGREISNGTRVTGLNNNDLIIGPSGAGKTRGYVIPNLLQCQESVIVADGKGGLERDLGGILAGEGYQVVKIDFTDCRHAWGYNPLDYIRRGQDGRSQRDIMTNAAGIVPLATKNDPFWDLSARLFLESMLAYVVECLPPEEQDLGSVAVLFGEMGTARFVALFTELGALCPDSFAAPGISWPGAWPVPSAPTPVSGAFWPAVSPC